jgi:hypothetical protein
MPIDLNVSADIRRAEQALRGLKNGTSTVVVRSMNRAIRKAQTVAVKSMAQALPALRQRTIRQATALKLARRNDWVAATSAKGGRIPIMDLQARQTQRGVTYRAQGGRRLIPGAFIARMSSGHAGVFKRKGRSRLPIQELYGPSIPRVFVQRYVLDATDAAARDEWARESARQINLLRTQNGL